MNREHKGWKYKLFEYVNLINAAMGNEKKASFSQLQDETHAERIQNRMLRTEKRNACLGITTSRSEIRARIEKCDASQERIEVVLSLHVVGEMKQNNRFWQEERIEREKVQLILRDQGWEIDTIQPLLIESELTEDQPVLEGEREKDPSSKPLSSPLIHPQLLEQASARFCQSSAPLKQETELWQRSTTRDKEFYHRGEAVAYAERWWNTANPAYVHFEVNCTNYVSQCLFAGGAPFNYNGKKSGGWWYRRKPANWSSSWVGASALNRYLKMAQGKVLKAYPVQSPYQLDLGDIISYDWRGKGRVGHHSIVTAFTFDGSPLVNGNSVNSRHRIWDYQDSHAWFPDTRYYFHHIADEF